jgi:hypothetical protein
MACKSCTVALRDTRAPPRSTCGVGRGRVAGERERERGRKRVIVKKARERRLVVRFASRAKSPSQFAWALIANELR